MSKDGFVQIPPNSTGAEIDCSSLSVAGQVVMRQRIVIGDPTRSATFALVSAGSLQVLVQNTTVPVSGQISVTGSVAVSTIGAGTNHIGEVNISVFPALVAGTAHIGEVNISTMPAVVLAAGTAHAGEFNISLMPAVVLAAGAAHVGEVNISLMPTVNVNIAAQSAGNAVIVQGQVAFNASVTAGNNPVLMGARVKLSASTTAAAKDAQFLWADKGGRLIVQMNNPSLHPSASHGPKTVTLSGSANTVLVASAGTACIFVDGLLVTSNLAAVAQCDIYETASSAAPEVSQYLGIGGGGFQIKFDPPWQLSAGQALSGRMPNAAAGASAQVLVTVHFHVGPN